MLIFVTSQKWKRTIRSVLGRGYPDDIRNGEALSSIELNLQKITELESEDKWESVLDVSEVFSEIFGLVRL